MNKYRLVPTETSLAATAPSADLNQTLKPDNQSLSEKMSFIELFSPRFRQRAKLMLSHLTGKIEIMNDNRIVYLEPIREEGSSLYDLIYFFISPTPPNGYQVRPTDAYRFGKILESARVPLYAYGSGKANFAERIMTMQKTETDFKPKMKSTKKTVNKWKKLY